MKSGSLFEGLLLSWALSHVGLCWPFKNPFLVPHNSAQVSWKDQPCELSKLNVWGLIYQVQVLKVGVSDAVYVSFAPQ